MAHKHNLGAWGEELALRHYLDAGYELLERNAHYRVGELDVVLRAIDNTLVFVEVKTRSGEAFGTGEAITPAKLRRMRQAAVLWMNENGWSHCRFDAVVIVAEAGRALSIDIYEGVELDAC